MALIHVDFFSEILGMSSQMEVILPQETEGQIGIGHVEKQSKYPVLYLLHGMTVTRLFGQETLRLNGMQRNMELLLLCRMLI